MSEVIEAEATEIAVTGDALPSNLFRTDNPAEVLQRAQETADALMPMVRSKGLVANIQGRDHLRVEAWTTLGAMLGVTPVCQWTRKLDNGWEARVEARTLDGRVIGAAEAECLRAESTWRDRDDYALRSMAQTRATSKALASVLRFVATLGGAAGTPAEEMPSGGSGGGSNLATAGQRSFLFGDGNKPGLFDRGGATSAEVAQIIHLLTKGGDREGLTKHNASKLIEALKGGDDAPKDQPKITVERWRKAIEAGVKAGDADSIAAQQAGSDSPADTEGLGAEPVDGVPF